MKLYGIAADGSSLVKIGKTDGVLRNRVSGLQTGSPVKLRLIWAATSGHRLNELRLHEHFLDRRSHGEWFDLGEDPVAEIRAAVKALGLEVDEMVGRDLGLAVPSPHLASRRIKTPPLPFLSGYGTGIF